MKIITKDGVAEPLFLSDIQINNRWLKALAVTMFLFFVYVIWLTYYIIQNNVLNNIVARCI
ncbi:MAG: hypothetical protein AABY22_21725 [Nanoarchaeota archaeon]